MKIRNTHPQCPGFPGGSVVKNPPASAGAVGSRSRSGRSPGEKKWHSTPVFLPGKSHGQRSIAGCSPWVCKELGMTEQLNNNILSVHQGLGAVLSGSYQVSIFPFTPPVWLLLTWSPFHSRGGKCLKVAPLPHFLRGTAGSWAVCLLSLAALVKGPILSGAPDLSFLINSR